MQPIAKKNFTWSSLAVVLSVGLVAALPLSAASEEPQSEAALIPFEPRPASLMIQINKEAPELGNTLLTVKLDDNELERLASETGRVDFFVLGARETMTALRDDGVFPDASKGDALFSGLVFTDSRDLDIRAAADAEAVAKSQGRNLVFANRALVGQVQVSPFKNRRFQLGSLVALPPAASSLGSPTPGFANAFQKNVLMITHPGVVTDPTRTLNPCSPPALGSPLPAWSFGRLMTDMANQGLTGIDPRVFVEDWLDHWLVPQTVNTFNVPARTAMQNIIDDWRAASGGGLLDLGISPFRLMAIVPRVDLRTTTTGGGGYSGASGTNFLDAGEGRFVFGVVDPFNGGCQEMPFTVILEYGVPLSSCTAVKQWAQDWSALDTMVIGGAAYNNHLQNLTDVFAAAGADPPKPNENSINQIRSNENELNPTWELREFQLVDPTPSMLSQTTVANTPDFSFNNGPLINSYIGPGGNPNPMPLNHPVAGFLPFRAGSALLPGGPGTFWDGNPSMPGPASQRHELSLNTCNGCHARETDTFFVHINPAPTSSLSFVPLLSDFLIGTNVINPGPSNTVDPVDGTVRFFDDLDRRETDINTVAGMSCFSLHALDFAKVSEELRIFGVLPVELVNPESTHQEPAIEMSFDLLSQPGITQVH